MENPSPKEKIEISYESLEDIKHRHGELVWMLYRFTDRVSQISISHRLRALPHSKSSLHHWLDPDNNKPLPAWQDRVTLVPMIVLTLLGSVVAFIGPKVLAYAGALIAGYALFIDTVNYYVRVLWFDDLKPGIYDAQRDVWSHRRILFLAILGYLQSIILFPSIYRATCAYNSVPFPNLLRTSFLTATLANVPPDLGIIGALQVLTSLFFLAVVIAVISSSGYERSEIDEN